MTSSFYIVITSLSGRTTPLWLQSLRQRNVTPSDSELVALFIRAERIASRVAGKTVSEDIASETVIRAVKSWSRIHDHAEAWVGRVATNLAIDALRRRRLEPRSPVRSAVARGFEDDVADRMMVRAALERLPARQRQVLVLHHLVGLSDREVAAALGTSVATVRTHLGRARQALRDHEPLSQREENDDDVGRTVR